MKSSRSSDCWVSISGSWAGVPYIPALDPNKAWTLECSWLHSCVFNPAYRSAYLSLGLLVNLRLRKGPWLKNTRWWSCIFLLHPDISTYDLRFLELFFPKDFLKQRPLDTCLDKRHCQRLKVTSAAVPARSTAALAAHDGRTAVAPSSEAGKRSVKDWSRVSFIFMLCDFCGSSFRCRMKRNRPRMEHHGGTYASPFFGFYC